MNRSSTFASLLLATAITAPAMTFVHPGTLSNRAELEFVKAKIAAGAEPWTSAFNDMKSLATAYTRTTAPLDGNENAQKIDGRKAYANALTWYFTGDAKYADQAIAVLNLWGKSFAGYAVPDVDQGNQSQLNAGWIGALLGPAADIMRGYAGWNPNDMATVQEMFKTKFYPALNQMSPWNGNVDLTQIDAMMSLAVFNEDEAEFEAGLDRLKRRDSAYFYLTTDRPGSKVYGGSNTAAWNDANGKAPLKWIDGLTQETCRDNTHHAQYAMASAIHAAEVAWHQGVDVYTPDTKRYTAVMELMAAQLTTGSMQGTCVNDATTMDYFDTWEIGYNHFHNRMGIDLPNTESLIKQSIRSEGASDWNIFFETLTHADLGAAASIQDRRAGNAMSISVLRDGRIGFTPTSTGIVHVSVRSLDGVLMAHAPVDVVAGVRQNISLGMEHAPRGIYLAQLESNGQIATIKYGRHN